MRYQLLTDGLVDKIVASAEDGSADWIVLSTSEEFPGYWTVDPLPEHNEFYYDFDDLIGRYSIISPVRVDSLLERAQEAKYQVVFAQDPVHILDAYAALKELPPCSLNSDLENTVQGFLPWQIIGFNKLVRDESLPGSMAIWDTGTGKTALIASSLKYYEGRYDLGLIVVKAHNKIDTQRKLMTLGDLTSTVIYGEELKRFETYEAIEQQLVDGNSLRVIVNYEVFRNDPGIIGHFLTKRRCLFYWDEMPTKLSNRNTQLYADVKSALYESFVSKPRPSWMRHLMLTATPIENDPDGLYSCVNLICPRILGTVTAFQNEHVATRSFFNGKPKRWKDLDKVEAQLDHMTHRVSKDDPDVAKMFPDVISIPMVIDWNPKHRTVYDRFTDAAKDILKEEGSGINVLSMIQVLQMLCDAPSMIKASAENREAFVRLLEDGEDWGEGLPPLSGPTGSEAATRLLSMVKTGSLTDTGHTKLDAWRDIILEKHPDEKIVTHSTWAGYIFPVWKYWLEKWGVSYVTYTGTEKQRQTALDAFREDPTIRVFLSGDSGADSIDIPQASVGVNYNGPWKWTTEHQREGRRDRVNSTFETIWTYTLSMANSVEDRKQEIRNLKHGYHKAIFEGRAVEGSLSARLTESDLRYMLLGHD